MKKTITLIAFIFLFAQCKVKTIETTETNKNTGLIADSAMVVSAREEASKIGVAIMKKGGN
ncbi:MAG: gamma-glutamyltransferase, partial [Lutibacter sp.]|nr:gamma-glutamyltransferase [Lutibacter sp.]